MGKYVVGDTFTISITKIIRHEDKTLYYIKGFKEPFTEKELDKIWDLEPSLSDQEQRMRENYRQGYSDGFADGQQSAFAIQTKEEIELRSNDIEHLKELLKSRPFGSVYSFDGEVPQVRYGIRIL